MKEIDAIRRQYKIPKNVRLRVTNYSKLSNREVIDRITRIELELNDETFEGASNLNELQLLKQEVRKKKLRVPPMEI